MAILKFASAILAWIVKNIALIIGILEALVKVISGIITLTPTKSDDKLLPIIDNVFSWIKKALYWASEKLAGKEVTIPN